jgi:two-component system, sensor histidine kinase PdtaS
MWNIRSQSFVDTARAYASARMDTRERHLRLLTDTIEAVNSTLDLQGVLTLVATRVAAALETDACFVYLYDERADELVLRATHGTSIDEMTRRPRMRPGEGITGSAAAARAPVMLESQAHLDPRFKNFPNLPEDEYESILAVPILTRDGTLEGALNVRTRRPRTFSEDEVDLLLAIAAQVAQSIEHAKLYAEAQRRVHELEALARISEAVSESLYLEESLEAIVKTTMDALAATGAALVLDDGHIAWPEGAASRHAIRQPLRWRGRQIGELVADRETAFTDADRELLASIATHAAVALEHGRAVMRGVLAQEIHHRVKNNLQTVASLLRLQARSADTVDPREALEHSVNRILAIAAVHELLTERREEDVELADLIGRLRAMLVQGVGGGKQVSSTLAEVTLPGARATALALVFAELLQNALEHGGSHIGVELARRDAEVVLAISDDGAGVADDAPAGTGLSIVRALVRDELRGTLELSGTDGTRAEVVFPAA